MKYLFVLAMILAIAGMGYGQMDGDSPLCSEIVSGTDTTCNNFANSCALDHGCTGYTFTASCTGLYDIDAWISCPGGAPDDMDCAACANVAKQTDPFVNIGSCDTRTVCQTATVNRKTCSRAVELTAGVGYILYVCKVYCPSNNNCDNCATNCVAHGCVRYAVTAPCY